MLISNPPGTDRYIANGSTPILVLPFCHIIVEGIDVNGFILNDYKIDVVLVQVRNTKCGGNLCDRQQESIGRCACYQMNNRTGNVIVTGKVVITLADGNSFSTSIRSKWLVENYIMSGPLPQGTQATHFGYFEVEDRHYKAWADVTEYVNRLGNFRIVGWAKCGEIQGQGVAQPVNGLQQNAARVMVQSGTLNHHICRIKPMKPSALNQVYLNTLEFDIQTGFRVKTP